MSLAKVLVVVDKEVNVRDAAGGVVGGAQQHRSRSATRASRWGRSTCSITRAARSRTARKMGIDATRKWPEEGFTREWPERDRDGRRDEAAGGRDVAEAGHHASASDEGRRATAMSTRHDREGPDVRGAVARRCATSNFVKLPHTRVRAAVRAASACCSRRTSHRCTSAHGRLGRASRSRAARFAAMGFNRIVDREHRRAESAHRAARDSARR